MKDAFRKLCLTGTAAIIAGVLYTVVMVSTRSGSFSEVIGFGMACSNTYGVFIIIFLMGSGLVALPRRLWQLADYEAELQRLFISVRNSSYGCNDTAAE
jgi:hypothetical protein